MVTLARRIALHPLARLLSLLLAFAAGAAFGIVGFAATLVAAEWRRRTEGGI